MENNKPKTDPLLFNVNKLGLTTKGSNYMVWTIANSLVELDTTNSAYRLVLNLEGEDGEQSVLMQYLNFTKSGEMKKLIYPGGEGKEGAKYPNSILFDVLNLANKYNEEEYQKRKDELKSKYSDSEEGWLRKEFLDGLSFEIETYKNEGEKGIWYKLMTDRQRQKDEEWKNNNPNTNVDNQSLDNSESTAYTGDGYPDDFPN